jgi:hypothetical protein
VEGAAGAVEVVEAGGAVLVVEAAGAVLVVSRLVLVERPDPARSVVEVASPGRLAPGEGRPSPTTRVEDSPERPAKPSRPSPPATSRIPRTSSRRVT